MFDAIVVGSGPSGVVAASGLVGLKVLMLDVGIEPPAKLLHDDHLTNLKRDNDERVFSALIGDSFDSLSTIDGEYRSPKLKGPLMKFILSEMATGDGPDLSVFDAHISYARGGLANAWGAGLFRYTAEDLADFPVPVSELESSYDDLTRMIGISGSDDDLSQFFGSRSDLLPALPLSPLAASLLQKYSQRKSRLNAEGLFMGRPRVSILSREHQGRQAYVPRNHDFFQAPNDSIYHPSITLKVLQENPNFSYRPGYKVVRFVELKDGIRITAINLSTKQEEHFESKALFLAAGALNTSKITLQSFDDYQTTLPLLDNPVSFIPLINPFLIGTASIQTSYPGAELILVDRSRPEKVQASIYTLNGPLMTDLLSEMPLSTKSNLNAIRYLLPAMGMLQLFYPDTGAPENFVQLRSDGQLKFSYSKFPRGEIEKRYVKMLNSFWYLARKNWCKFPPPGSSIHYAGCLPMNANAGKYQTSPEGVLHGTRAVHVVDGASLPALPAKNHSFTMMANALRITKRYREKLSL